MMQTEILGERSQRLSAQALSGTIADQVSTRYFGRVVFQVAKGLCRMGIAVLAAVVSEVAEEKIYRALKESPLYQKLAVKWTILDDIFTHRITRLAIRIILTIIAATAATFCLTTAPFSTCAFEGVLLGGLSVFNGVFERGFAAVYQKVENAVRFVFQMGKKHEVTPTPLQERGLEVKTSNQIKPTMDLTKDALSSKSQSEEEVVSVVENATSQVVSGLKKDHLTESVVQVPIKPVSDLKTAELKSRNSLEKIETKVVDHSEGGLKELHSTETLIQTPIPGKILRIAVKVGDVVEEGDLLLVVEAMKMEHSVRANQAGTVTELRVKMGQQIENEGALLRIE